MKPKKIFLIRHGESEGNVDPAIYATKPDYTLLLTPRGRLQAERVGEELVSKISDGSVMYYISPFWRTRETFELLHTKLAPKEFRFREEPRLREQEWGHLRSAEESRTITQQRNEYGTFYFRIPDGESCADVYDRVSTFLETMHRDFEKADFPENVVIVTHGMMVRLFLMRWYQWSVEEFETYCNPKNGSIFEMHLEDSGKYKLLTPLPKYKTPSAFSRPLKLRTNSRTEGE